MSPLFQENNNDDTVSKYFGKLKKLLQVPNDYHYNHARLSETHAILKM